MLSANPLEVPRGSGPSTPKPLNEAICQTRPNKNFEQERRRTAYRRRVLRWGVAALLIIAAAVFYLLGSSVPAYGLVARFPLALGLGVLLFESARARRHAFTGVFALIALLLLPTSALSRNALVLVATVLLFIASLVWANRVGRPAAVSNHPG